MKKKTKKTGYSNQTTRVTFGLDALGDAAKPSAWLVDSVVAWRGSLGIWHYPNMTDSTVLSGRMGFLVKSNVDQCRGRKMVISAYIKHAWSPSQQRAVAAAMVGSRVT